MKQAFVDANVVLRYLTKDPPTMAEASLKLFTAAQKGKISLKMISITVAEVVWVLESFYSYSKNEIAETLTQFLFSDGLTVENLDLIIEALALYQKKNLDFAPGRPEESHLQSPTDPYMSLSTHTARASLSLEAS